MHAMGVNRLSLGMQSAHPGELRLLERQHSFQEVDLAMQWARKAGFENINLDLIFGLPHQRLMDWQDSVKLALSLMPQHLSLYNLTLEHGTPLESLVGRGILPHPDPDIGADMFLWAMEYLGSEGWRHYEISNWAREGVNGQSFTCAHNMQYWRNYPYIGLGAGAHGFVGGYRVADVLSPAAYIERCFEGAPGGFPRTPATVSAIQVDEYLEMQETMMMGLRLLDEGVSSTAFARRFGKRLEEIFLKEVSKLHGLDLIEKKEDRWLLTAKGRMLGNQVFLEFV